MIWKNLLYAFILLFIFTANAGAFENVTVYYQENGVAKDVVVLPNATANISHDFALGGNINFKIHKNNPDLVGFSIICPDLSSKVEADTLVDHTFSVAPLTGIYQARCGTADNWAKITVNDTGYTRPDPYLEYVKVTYYPKGVYTKYEAKPNEIINIGHDLNLSIKFHIVSNGFGNRTYIITKPDGSSERKDPTESSAKDFEFEPVEGDYKVGIEGSPKVIVSVYKDNAVNVAPMLTDMNVSPSVGDPNTDFLISVMYTDANNDMATVKNIYIDETPYPMNIDSAESSPINGQKYSYTTKLNKGPHKYYFIFSDGKSQDQITSAYDINVIEITPNNPTIQPLEMRVSNITPLLGESITVDFKVNSFDLYNGLKIGDQIDPYLVIVGEDNDWCLIYDKIDNNYKFVDQIQPVSSRWTISTTGWTSLIKIDIPNDKAYVGKYKINAYLTSSGTSIVSTTPACSIEIIVNSKNGHLEYFNPMSDRWEIVYSGGPAGICTSNNVIFDNDGAIIKVPSKYDPIYNDHIGSGGEIKTKLQSFSYGYYEINVKTPSTPGVCSAFFLYGMPKDQNEIDIEILSKDNEENSGQVWFVVHLPGGRTQKIQHTLDFAPWKDYNKYGFEWKEDEIVFYVNGKLVNTGKEFIGSENVPSNTGYIMINNWSNGDTSWSAGPPESEALMKIKRVIYLPK